MAQKTELNTLIDLLGDKKWYWGAEIAQKVGWRFGSVIHRARNQGYSIVVEHVGQQHRYRLMAQNIVEARLPHILEQIPYLKLLILFGSRARGDHYESSDWDIAALYDEDKRHEYETSGWGWLRGWSIIQRELDLPDDDIDVVDLSKCSNLLAHAIARDGKLLYEKEPGEFEQFRQRALMSGAELKAIRDEQKAFIKQGLAKLKKC